MKAPNLATRVKFPPNMSLTYSEIEAFLDQGVSFEKAQNEYIARLNPKSDEVSIVEMTALRRGVVVPFEAIVDRAHADDSGSDIRALAELRRMLASFVP